MPQFCEEAFPLQVSTCSQSVEKYSGEAEHPQNHPPNQPPNQQTTQPTNHPTNKPPNQPTSHPQLQMQS